MKSKYFTLREATNSNTASKLGIENKPNKTEMEYIEYTADRMDFIRELLGVPLIVNSWFRCEELNNAVGGSKTSAHRFGLAVDVYSNKMDTETIYKKLIKAMELDFLSFDQLIYYPNKNFVHIGFKSNRKDERKMFWESK